MSWEQACKKCGRCCMERVMAEGELVYTGRRCPHLTPDGTCDVYLIRFTVNPG